MFKAGTRAAAVLTAIIVVTTGLSSSVSAAGKQLTAPAAAPAQVLDFSKLSEQEKYQLAAPSEEQVGFKEINPSAAGVLASGCGSRCDFKNPQTYYIYWCGLGCEDNWRCSDDGVVKDTVGVVELKYSPSCRTVWARWDYISPHSAALIISYYSGWNERTSSVGAADLNNAYTLMLNDANLCGRAAWRSGPITEYTDLCY